MSSADIRAARTITAARGHDWSVLIEQTQGSREGERTSLATLGPHLVDGAIVSPEAPAAEDFAALPPGLPLVLLGEHAVGLPAGNADGRAPTELVTPFSLRVRAGTGPADG